MTESQSRRLALFVENTQAIKSEFFWQQSMMKHLAALLYAARDRSVDIEAIRQSLDLLKARAGVLSMFRGNSALNIAAMLSLAPERERLLTDTMQVYDALKAAGFWKSDFLVVAAFQIASGTSADQYQTTVFRARSFYEGMKAQHPLLTGSDDCIFSAMLGLSDADVSDGVARMEELYRALKPEFFSGDGVQALTQVLVLGGRTAEAAGRVLKLRQAFRDRGLKLENQYTLSSLGVLSLLPGSAADIARDVAEVFEDLRARKGFSAWSFPKQELVLYAAALTAYDHVEGLKNELLTTTLSTGITNIVIAQQAVVAATAASSAAAASSGS